MREAKAFSVAFPVLLLSFQERTSNMADASLTEPIIIVGGGTFGTTTAFHLAKKGYTNISIIDRFTVPSPEVAGNGINKVVRTEYLDPASYQAGN